MFVGSMILVGALRGQAPASRHPATVDPGVKLVDLADRFVLRSVVRTEGKWLASLEDRKTGDTIAWLERNQLLAGFFLKEISEKSALLVEQRTGRIVTLHLRPATVTKDTNGAVPVIEHSGAPEAGGLTRASSLMDKVQANPAGNLLVPRLAPPLEEKLKTKDSGTSTGGSAAEPGTNAKPSSAPRR